MKKIKHFGYNSIEEFENDYDCAGELDWTYYNSNGEEFNFLIWTIDKGVSIRHNSGTDYYNGIAYEDGEIQTFDSLRDMIENYIMPDGVRMIDVWNGENYDFE